MIMRQQDLFDESDLSLPEQLPDAGIDHDTGCEPQWLLALAQL